MLTLLIMQSLFTEGFLKCSQQWGTENYRQILVHFPSKSQSSGPGGPREWSNQKLLWKWKKGWSGHVKDNDFKLGRSKEGFRGPPTHAHTWQPLWIVHNSGGSQNLIPSLAWEIKALPSSLLQAAHQCAKKALMTWLPYSSPLLLLPMVTQDSPSKFLLTKY